jgi:FMN phosphatase YigB (HAD superfamily)
VIDVLHAKLKFTSREESKRLFHTWLWSSLRDYFATSHNGPYIQLMVILRSSLQRTISAQGYNIIIDTDSLCQIMDTFKTLDPMPTAVDAIRLLQKQGNWNIWAITNGGKEATANLLRRAGILDAFGGGANIQSCDDLLLSKPHPRVYTELMRTVIRQTKVIEVRCLHPFELFILLVIDIDFYAKELLSGCHTCLGFDGC